MIQSTLRRIPFQHVTSIVFLLVTAVVLAGGLGEVVRGARLSAFVPVGLAAALAGWGLGSRRLNGGWAAGGLFFLGVALLWGSTAQFGGPLLQLAESLPASVYQAWLLAWDQKVVPDFSATSSAWLSLVTQSSGLWQRLVQWLQSLQSGNNRYDPVIYVLGWSFLLWLVVAWAGWFMRRGQILSATVPSLMLLAEVTYITNADVTPLLIMLGITLLLMGLTHFRVTFTGWVKRGIDYAEIILDTTIAFILLVTLALVVSAWLTPSISVKEIADAIRENSTAKPGASLAETLGLQTAEEKAAALAPYNGSPLPDTHFIGAGPELSRDLVMTISTGELPPGQTFELVKVAPYHRWRSNTLDRYIGTGWGNARVDNLSYAANTPVFPQIPEKYRVLRQTVRVTEQSSGKLYWDGVLLSVDQPFNVSWRSKPQTTTTLSDKPFHEADMLGVLSDAQTYEVTSLIATMDAQQLQAAPGAYSETIRRRYLELPESVPERVLALAREITATAPTPYDQAQAIEAYLRKTYPYTLNIPAPPYDRDVVDYFLFDLKKGFCDYYATAMVVLGRAVGLPSRIVFGYASGSYDPAAAEYNIVKADAHAWVEVYFPQVGWVEFDPTANQPPINRPLYSDPANNPVRPANQQGWLDNWLAVLQSSAPDFTRWGMLGAIGLVAVVVMLQLGEFLFLSNISTVRAMQIIYRGLYRVGRKVTGPTIAGETTEEFAALLHSQLKRIAQRKLLQKPFTSATRELNLLTDLYLRAIYTPRPPEKTEIRAALRAWQTLRWRLLLASLIPNRKSQIQNRKSKIVKGFPHE